MSASCVFCKIAAKEIPALVVYDDVDTFAFLDIRPLANGHTLVIPKAHGALVQDLTPETNAALGRAVGIVAGKVQRATGAPSATIGLHNGPEAGQEVPHVHYHVVPRFPRDDAGPIHALFPSRPQPSKDELGEMAERIRKA